MQERGLCQTQARKVTETIKEMKEVKEAIRQMDKDKRNRSAMQKASYTIVQLKRVRPIFYGSDRSQLPKGQIDWEEMEDFGVWVAVEEVLDAEGVPNEAYSSE